MDQHAGTRDRLKKAEVHLGRYDKHAQDQYKFRSAGNDRGQWFSYSVTKVWKLRAAEGAPIGGEQRIGICIMFPHTGDMYG